MIVMIGRAPDRRSTQTRPALVRAANARDRDLRPHPAGATAEGLAQAGKFIHSSSIARGDTTLTLL